MNRTRLMAALLVAALPLVGCGNKGPLIRVPDVQGAPPEAPAESTSTMPADSGSIVLPADTGTDSGTDDGTTGSPR